MEVVGRATKLFLLKSSMRKKDRWKRCHDFPSIKIRTQGLFIFQKISQFSAAPHQLPNMRHQFFFFERIINFCIGIVRSVYK